MLNVTFETSLLTFSEERQKSIANIRDSEEMFCCSGVSGGC